MHGDELTASPAGSQPLPAEEIMTATDSAAQGQNPLARSGARPASVPVPTLVSRCSTSAYKRRNQRDTSNSMNLVRLLDLTFLRRTRGNTGRNVKSAALKRLPADLNRRDSQGVRNERVFGH
jgi:hypothetical protein